MATDEDYTCDDVVDFTHHGMQLLEQIGSMEASPKSWPIDVMNKIFAVLYVTLCCGPYTLL